MSPDPADTGLFGKLPRSRPGTRSPRRSRPAESDPAPPRADAPAAEAPDPVAQSRPTPPRVSEPVGSDPMPPQDDEAAASEGPDPSAAEGQGAAGLEELAWAGIAVTAEAATLGVRLMSRALDAARRATERG